MYVYIYRERERERERGREGERERERERVPARPATSGCAAKSPIRPTEKETAS